MISMNMSLINWLSKRQATVESAVFGAEFVAMKQGVETLRGIRYKLRMMGVPVDGPTYIYGDNMSVVNTPSSQSQCLRRIFCSIRVGGCLIPQVRVSQTRFVIQPPPMHSPKCFLKAAPLDFNP